MNQKREVDTRTAQFEVWWAWVRRGRRVRGRRWESFIVGWGEEVEQDGLGGGQASGGDGVIGRLFGNVDRL